MYEACGPEQRLRPALPMQPPPPGIEDSIQPMTSAVERCRCKGMRQIALGIAITCFLVGSSRLMATTSKPSVRRRRVPVAGQNEGGRGLQLVPCASLGRRKCRRATHCAFDYADETCRSDEVLAFKPKAKPTERPTESTPPPTEDVYYPDAKRNVCRTETAGSGFTRFGSIETCCDYPWMYGDSAQCVKNSIELRDTTPDPTRNPTRPPTRLPTRRPVEEDVPGDGNENTDDYEGDTQSEAKVVSCAQKSKKQCRKDSNCHWHMEIGCEANVILYYPKAGATKCVTSPPNDVVTGYSTIEECCSFPWIKDSTSCMINTVDELLRIDDDAIDSSGPSATPATANPAETKLDAQGIPISPDCYSGRKWHRARTTTEDSECTNDKNYPSAWNHESMSSYFLFDRPGRYTLFFYAPRAFSSNVDSLSWILKPLQRNAAKRISMPSTMYT